LKGWRKNVKKSPKKQAKKPPQASKSQLGFDPWLIKSQLGFDPWLMGEQVKKWYLATTWHGAQELRKRLRDEGFDLPKLLCHLESMVQVLKLEVDKGVVTTPDPAKFKSFDYKKAGVVR
jgi:hypothetical protein